MKRPIDYRDPKLLVALLGALYEADDPIPEADLLDAYSRGRWSTNTIRRALRELADFGALRRTGGRAVAGPPTPVAYRMTALGRAWADRRLEPYVGPSTDDEEPEHPDRDP